MREKATMFPFDLGLAPDSESVPGYGHLNLVLIHARYLKGDCEPVIEFPQVHSWSEEV